MQQETFLTHKQLEMHGCALSTVAIDFLVAIDVLVLKHHDVLVLKAISIHNVD